MKKLPVKSIREVPSRNYRCQKMSLKEEILSGRRSISVQSYSMSIGELLSLYKDNELDLHPEFQRIYRWTNQQRINLIESILLGIPIPSLFVSQKRDGKWDVIDGVQRLSTIFEFMGELKDDNGNKLPPLVLERTKSIPSLDKVSWQSDKFDSGLRLSFKRERLNLIIIKEELSSPSSKFDLFQRINSGGTNLSKQELRNCLIVMVNADAWNYLRSLEDNVNFQNCISISSRKDNESYDMELIIRYFYLIDQNNNHVTGNLDHLLDDFTERFSNNFEDSKEFLEKKNIFEKTFSLLSTTLGENSFRKYDKNKKKFTGPFTNYSFEAIIPGLVANLDYWQNHTKKLEIKIKNIYTNPEFTQVVTKAGIRGPDRMNSLKDFSINWFKQN